MTVFRPLLLLIVWIFAIIQPALVRASIPARNEVPKTIFRKSIVFEKCPGNKAGPYVAAKSRTDEEDAFGTLLSINGTTPNSYLYCGESYDANLGLYYLRARLMNPLTGRFWTADSYEGSNADPASLHKYLYAHGDGVNGSDPTGNSLLTQVMITGGVGAIIGGLGAVAIASYLNPDITEEELWSAAAWGAGTGVLGGIGFGIKVASAFIQSIRILAAAGLTYISAQEAIMTEDPKEMKVYAAMAVLGVLGVRSMTGNAVASEGAVIARTWNEFQSSTKGQFATRAEAAAAWAAFKQANGIAVNVITRSTAQRSAFLKSLVDDWKTPAWMKEYLKEGRVPPGYEVDHIKPLFQGGPDTPANMRLQSTDLHRNHHVYVRPS